MTPARLKEPLSMTDLPPEPWQLIAADIFGPLPTGQKILVLKCLHSKWPEIKIFLHHQSTHAQAVIAAMKKMFSILGIPDVIRTDNGPPFCSASFRDFAKMAGFHHQKVSPLWPQANGQAEAFMKCLGKVIRAAVIEKKDWSRELDKFLQDKVREFNSRAMGKAKAYADGKNHAKPHQFSMGDRVLVRQRKVNKFSPYYDPQPFHISPGWQIILKVREKSFFPS